VKATKRDRGVFVQERTLNYFAMAACLLILAFSAALRCYGQATYGSIVGTARDSSGGVVPGVQVTVANEATGVKATELTNDVGAYSFTTLFQGKYSIHAQMNGFQSVDITRVELQVDQTLRFDLTMQVGQVNQTMEVVATLAPLATDTSDVGQVVEDQQVVDLPLNGRMFVQLAALTNDVYLYSVSYLGGAESAGPNIQNEGGRYVSDSYLVDGVETRIVRNSTYGLSPSVDSIGEFKLLQNSFSAEYGRAQTILTTTLKNGTNHFHGDVFDFLRNNVLDARYAFNFTGTTQPLRQNQFGSTLGGAIRKEKLFFFLSYEGFRYRFDNATSVEEPTAAQLGGNLSTMSLIATDPNTGHPFPGNIIPPGRISQFAQAGAQSFTPPSGPSAPGYNLTAFTGEVTNSEQGIARIDYYLNNNNRFDGFLSIVDYYQDEPAPNPYSGFVGTRSGRVGGGEYTHIFSPTILNNLHLGYTHNFIVEGQDKVASTNLAPTFGLQNVNPDSFAYGPPGIGITGFQYAGPQAWQPTGTNDINRQLSDMLTVTRGHHILKVGTDLRWLTYEDRGWATQEGEIYFNGQYTGNPMADYLLGLPDYAHVAQRGSGDYPYTLQWGEVSFFAQDDIKLKPELTLNLGLRYEFVQLPRETHNEFTNWDFTTMNLLYAGKTMPERILPTPKTDFEPRLGLAYSPKWLPKTVFRGGFAIMNGNFRANNFGYNHFQLPYVNDIYMSNNIPTPSFTTATIFPAPITTCCTGVNLTLASLYHLDARALPMYYEYNFNIQRELPHNFLLQVGYVGSRGKGLSYLYDANQASPFDPNNPLTIAQRVPYPTLGYVQGTTSGAYSRFNAFNVHVERRFSNGMAIIGAYSWAKDMEIGLFDGTTVINRYNLALNYGPENMAGHAVISYVYELPFGPGKRFAGSTHGALGQVIGGWQFNGITTLNSGSPLTATSDIGNGGDNGAGNKADATGLPANLPRGQRTEARWFNTAAFADLPYTRFGNAGFGTITGPGLWNFDLSFFKNLKFTESKYLQFRWEMFNALNHVNLGNPATDVTDQVHFGTINSAASARIMQAALKFYF